MSRIRVVYRMSARCGRISPPYFNNETCFVNFKNAMPSADIHAILDNADDSCEEIMKKYDTPYERTQLGNAKAYNRAMDIVTEKASSGEWDINDIFYLCENDYAHRPGAEFALVEGLHFADYVSLYDHPDKYPEMWGDQDHCGVKYSEIRSKIVVGRSGHWRSTISTCGTYGTSISNLLQDMDVHRKFAKMEDDESERPQTKDEEKYVGNGAWREGVHDAPLFHHLVLTRGRRLMSPIPGYATHGDMFSPHVNWEQVIKDTAESMNQPA